MAPVLANCPPIEWLPAMFGIVPHWQEPKRLSRITYNARSEAVAEKPSCRSGWKKRQFALIPGESFFKPCYESGKAVRWPASGRGACTTRGRRAGRSRC